MSLSMPVNRFALLFAVLIITACSNNESSFVAAPQAADKGSIVYIYRPSATTNFMLSPKVVIDDNEKFNIGGGDYRYVYLQTGNHSVGLNSTDRYSTGAAVTINVEADKNYYLRVSTSLKFEAEKMNTRKFWIDIIAEKQALAEIGSTEYSGPRLQQSSEGQAEEHQDKEGFTVDKTQDPFAGKYESP